jgi:hypothetical protein
MKKRSINLLVVIVTLMLGCKKEDATESQNELWERFHGKYAITRATSNIAVDVNLDGSKSTNLVEEIPDLKYTYLELLIGTKTSPNGYAQYWANQSLNSEQKPAGYDPSILVMYLNQPTVASFEFNDDLTVLSLHQEPSKEPQPEAFSLPESVTIGKDNEITVKMKRTLYTRAGWVPVSIVVTYARFTKIT